MKYNIYLPQFIINSRIIKEIIDTEFTQLDKIRLDIEDLRRQFFVDTATWGLAVYEKELQIETDLNKDIEERRSNIKAKFRGRGKVDDKLIKSVVDSYTNGNVDVDFKDSTIIITFNDIKGRPSNISDVKTAIESIIPCHLVISYIYTYLTWQEFDKYNKTWKEWDSLNLTWYEFERYIEKEVYNA